MMLSKVRVGVIGYGYWGPNLVRNFLELDDTEVVAVCDRRIERREHLERLAPKLQVISDWRRLVSDPGIDAVVIATQVSTHYGIAREALDCGKHILVEKPLVPSADQARDLLERADRRGCVLMAGHTFLYHGGIRKVRELIQAGELGDLLYLDSVRANLGILQDDVNVVWDLAPHDVSIMDFLVGDTPVSVSATGMCHTGRKLEDIAFLTFRFAGDFIAHLNVNWLSPVKIRSLMIGGRRKMVVFDDTEPSEKVKVFDRGLEREDSPDKRHNDLLLCRAGDIYVPQLDLTEALQLEARDFVECIRCSRRPQADGLSALRIVRLLELACKSLAQGGAPIDIPGEFP